MVSHISSFGHWSKSGPSLDSSSLSPNVKSSYRKKILVSSPNSGSIIHLGEANVMFRGAKCMRGCMDPSLHGFCTHEKQIYTDSSDAVVMDSIITNANDSYLVSLCEGFCRRRFP